MFVWLFVLQLCCTAGIVHRLPLLHDVDLLDLVDVEDLPAAGTDDLAVVLAGHLSQGSLTIHETGRAIERMISFITN